MRSRRLSTLISLPNARVRVVCSITVLLLLPLVTSRALTAQDPIRTPNGIIFNFQNADLGYVLGALARAAGINYSALDLPAKQVTLYTPRAISPEEVATLIRQTAADNGVTVTQEGPVMRLRGVVQAPGADPRQLFIHRLKHARAPLLAQTLSQLFGGSVRAVQPGQAAANTLNQQLRAMELQIQQQRPGQPPVTIVTQGGARGELEGAVIIVPDEVTNSLLVRATPADWQIIQQALQSLDLRPLQVVIEVVIAEVRRTDELNVGLSVTGGDANPRPGEATTGGLPGGGTDDDFRLRIVRTGEIDVDATLSALARSGNVRVLSRPVVQAQNNQEALIRVGEQRPFIQVSRSLPTGEPVQDQVVQYIPVATTLTITPTINADGYVNLALVQAVDNATAEIQFDAPVISTREARTQILARNGQTVVIGGLVDRQQDRSRAGIPFLKDIPILGYLFGTTRSNTINSELFLFLTPYIVNTDEDADRVRQEIETKAELLRGITPIAPILPAVIRLPVPDTIRR